MSLAVSLNLPVTDANKLICFSVVVPLLLNSSSLFCKYCNTASSFPSLSPDIMLSISTKVSLKVVFLKLSSAIPSSATSSPRANATALVTKLINPSTWDFSTPCSKRPIRSLLSSLSMFKDFPSSLSRILRI